MGTQDKDGRHDQSRLRYASDLTDAEWAEVGRLIPPAKPGGNKRTVDIREIVNGVMYVLSTGCRWHAIPQDLPAKSTIHDYLDRWTCDGTLERVHRALYGNCLDRPSRPSRRQSVPEKDLRTADLAKAGRMPTAMLLRQERRSEIRRTTLWSMPRS